MTTPVQNPDANKTVLSIALLLLLTVGWWVGVAAWVQSENGSTRLLGIGPQAGSQSCDAPPRDGEVRSTAARSDVEAADPAPAAAATVDIPQEPVLLRSGPGRGALTTSLSLKLNGPHPPPEGTEVSASASRPSRTGGGTLDAPIVAARVLGGRLQVDLCVVIPSSATWNGSTGTYTAFVAFSDPRLAADAIPVTVEVQARYLWLLAPGVIWLPLLAWVVVGSGTPWTKSFCASMLAAIAGAAGVYAAKGLGDPTWGGGFVPVFALLTLMYGAAAGLLATANKVGST